MIFPNCERKKKLIHLLIVKKICLERTQYAFLDHPKTLVFLVTSSNYTHARALTPFIPIPRAPKKPSYSALRSAQKEDTEDKFLTRHWMLRCTRAPFGTFMKVFFRVLSGVVHYRWDAHLLGRLNMSGLEHMPLEKNTRNPSRRTNLIILFLTSRKITISEWIWFQFFEGWEMESARKNHLWLTPILK